jgi:ATP-binding protein involved in chromosome partitioning
MTVTKEQVVGALSGIAAPGGKSLPESGALSVVVVNDGKVFFSIGVEASAVPRWEATRHPTLYDRRQAVAVPFAGGPEGALLPLSRENRLAQRNAGCAHRAPARRMAARVPAPAHRHRLHANHLVHPLRHLEILPLRPSRHRAIPAKVQCASASKIA